MSVISWQRQGSVAVLSMDNGENRHNPLFISEFLAAMAAIEADPEVRAVVLASSDAKTWSQGIDLAWIQAAAADRARHGELRDFLNGLNSIFARVLTFPAPVIAAITGHAFGNGAILACACDFRLMRSDRGFFCFPEVDVNIPFLPGMMAIVEKAMPMYKLEELYFSGRRAGGQELADHHVVSKALEGSEAVVQAAIELGATFQKGRGIFGEMKRRKHARILEVFATADQPIITGLKLTA